MNSDRIYLIIAVVHQFTIPVSIALAGTASEFFSSPVSFLSLEKQFPILIAVFVYLRLGNEKNILRQALLLSLTRKL